MEKSQTIDEAPGPGITPDPDPGRDAVLDTLRAFREEEIRREQALILLAVQWVRLNPSENSRYRHEELYYSALTDMEYMWDELYQRGCPHVDDLSIPAFAEAAGLTEFQAARLVREAILLVYLLPRVWQKAAQGQIDVWRARKLAEECWELHPAAIAYIDRQMSRTTARHTEGGRAGVIDEARQRFMPEQVQAEEEAAKEERGVAINWEDFGRKGVAEFRAVLDIPDARLIEEAIQAGAEALKEQGSDAPLQVRRSWASGDLARGAGRSLPGCACGRGEDPARAHWTGAGAPATTVSVYLHLTAGAFAPELPELPAQPGQTGATGFSPIRVEGDGIPSGMVLTPDTVREWFNRPTGGAGPKITFRPVVDLEDHQHVEAYEVPDRIKELVGLRDGGCVFPWCHRKARRSDCDHTIPWRPDGSGGPTCSCNLAPMCRKHHRAKTHADNHKGSRYTWWRYESLGEGKYLWRGPGGSRLLRTNSGVYDVSGGRLSSGPLTPDRLGPEAIVQHLRETLPGPGEFDHRFPPSADGDEPGAGGGSGGGSTQPQHVAEVWGRQGEGSPPF